MPKTKMAPQTFTVRGRGPFPIDMLRHDRATPATEQDSGAITRTFSRDQGIAVHEVRVLALKVTPARWQSFGYTVDDAPGTTPIRAA